MGRLADDVGRASAVRRALHAAVLGDRPQPVGELPQRRPRHDPHDVGERAHEGDRCPEQHDLDGQDLPRLDAALAQAEVDALEVLVGAVPEEVAAQLAVPRVGGDRVAPVQRGVGLLGAELVAVVGEVDPAIGAERLERRVRQQPAPDDVVRPAVREQQAMGGLVPEDVEQAVAPAHQDEREQVRPPRVQPGGGDHDPERLHHRHHDGDHVAQCRDAAQLVAQRPGRAWRGR